MTFHCDDCAITLHENDKDTHLNGGRHRYRIRQKNNEKKNVEPQYECNVCESKFTNLDFYTIHMGSKTHKRNLRRLTKALEKRKSESVGNVLQGSHQEEGAQKIFPITPTPRRVPIQGIDKYLSIDDLKEVSYYKSTREKYRPRNITIQEGHNRTYILSATAYWAVSLALDSTVEDFKISLNEKDWGDFGDAVIQIQFKESSGNPGVSTTFGIQFKHLSTNIKNIDSFSDGKFNCAKYISQVSKVKLKESVENQKFVLFTTAATTPDIQHSFKLKKEVIHRNKKDCACQNEELEFSVVAKCLSNNRKLVVNTSDDNENIYFLFSTDNIHSLPKLYMYTRQKRVKNFGRAIDDFINDKLVDKRVDVHRDFIKYIEYWSDGYLGGNYRLKKEDVLVKLGHLLLFEFRVPPQVRLSENTNYGIWNQAVNSVDVTILTKQPVIIMKVCRPINMKIERELGVKIDTTTSTITLTQTHINSIQNPVLKMYLFEETLSDINDDIPLDIVYDVFWKSGLIPMILQAKDVKSLDHALQVISLLKSFGFTRRYFLETPHNHNIKPYLKYYKTLTYFVTVDDVVRKLPAFLLDYVKINVTDGFALSLIEIQDSDLFFQKLITANEFMDMSLGKYSFKSVDNHLAQKEHGVEDAKLILSDEMMVKLKEEVDCKSDMSSVGNHRNERRGLRGLNPGLFC